MSSFDYVTQYFNEVSNITKSIDCYKIDNFIDKLVHLKNRKGRLFIIGMGGSAGNASHMVNDMMKIAGIKAYAPSDNVSLLTAIGNDIDFSEIYLEYLKMVNFNAQDMLFVLSTSGNSPALIKAYNYALNEKYADVLSILGCKDGILNDEVNIFNNLLIPEISRNRMVPHAEEFQAVVWHCIVNDPRLKG